MNRSRPSRLEYDNRSSMSDRTITIYICTIYIGIVNTRSGEVNLCGTITLCLSSAQTSATL